MEEAARRGMRRLCDSRGFTLWAGPPQHRRGLQVTGPRSSGAETGDWKGSWEEELQGAPGGSLAGTCMLCGLGTKIWMCELASPAIQRPVRCLTLRTFDVVERILALLSGLPGLNTGLAFTGSLSPSPQPTELMLV